MVSAEAFGYAANVALGVVLLALGGLALRIPRSGPTRWLLSAYLAMVGANYAIDGVLYILVGPHGSPARVGLLDHLLMWTRLFDPPVLLLFALAVTGTRLTWTRISWIVLPSVWLALGLSWFAVTPWITLEALLTAAAYTLAFAVLVRRYVLQSDARERDMWGVLILAFSVVCMTRIPLLFLQTMGPTGRTSPLTLLMEASLLVTFGVFAIALRAFTKRPAWTHARGVLLATGGLLLVLDLVWLLRFVPYVWNAAFALPFSIRWFLFLAVVAAGLRRHEIMGIPVAVAPWLRRMLTGSLLVLLGAMVAALAASLPDATAETAVLAGIASVGLAVMAAVSLHAAVPRPPSEIEYRRAAVYRAHLALGSSERDLERVRVQIGLTLKEAQSIRETVQLEQKLPPEVLPDRIEPGRRLLGRYDVERVLGIGAFGRTYAATDTLDGTRVVLKELLDSWHDHPEALARFRREAETALRIRHPNLVEFRTIERLATGNLLILGFVEGETLAERLARGPLREVEAERLARDLLAGLAALHCHGILHRDVKPENVVIRPDGRAVLLDFGTVTGRDGATRLAVGAHPGTPGYESPEQERGEPLTPASDVYATAKLLWRALSGESPPASNVPAAWRAPLTRALAARPEGRPADAEAMLETLPA